MNKQFFKYMITITISLVFIFSTVGQPVSAITFNSGQTTIKNVYTSSYTGKSGFYDVTQTVKATSLSGKGLVDDAIVGLSSKLDDIGLFKTSDWDKVVVKGNAWKTWYTSVTTTSRFQTIETRTWYSATDVVEFYYLKYHGNFGASGSAFTDKLDAIPELCYTKTSTTEIFGREVEVDVFKICGYLTSVSTSFEFGADFTYIDSTNLVYTNSPSSNSYRIFVDDWISKNIEAKKGWDFSNSYIGMDLEVTFGIKIYDELFTGNKIYQNDNFMTVGLGGSLDYTKLSGDDFKLTGNAYTTATKQLSLNGYFDLTAKALILPVAGAVTYSASSDSWSGDLYGGFYGQFSGTVFGYNFSDPHDTSFALGTYYTKLAWATSQVRSFAQSKI